MRKPITLVILESLYGTGVYGRLIAEAADLSEMLPVNWKPDYERSTVHPRYFVGVIRPPQEKLDRPLKSWEHETYETLPDLPEGHMRVLHRTHSDDAVDSIRSRGLHFGHQGMLSSTAISLSKPTPADYSIEDPRFKHGRTVVMDVPFDEHRKLTRHNYRFAPPAKAGKSPPIQLPPPPPSSGDDSDDVW